MTTSLGVTFNAASARRKNRRAAAASRRAETSTSMTWPCWSIAEIGAHRHELHGRLAFAAWLGVHAELLANAGAELKAFTAWAEEFYPRPQHRSARLLDASTVDTPRINRRHRRHAS